MKQILFNPFQRYSEIQLIVFGIAFTFIGSWSAFQFGLRYDGALDLHFGMPRPWFIPFIDNAINSLCLTLFLFIAARIINAKTRLVDLVSTVLVARAPLYLTPFLNFDGSLSIDTTQKTLSELQAILFNNIGLVVVSAIIGFVALVWFIALLFNGYKTASNGKGGKAILFFIGGLLLAEISSKILIMYINH